MPQGSRPHDEGAEAGDDMVAIPEVEARFLVQDGEPVDRDIQPVGHGARLGQQDDPFPRRRFLAVAGDVDHLARALEAIVRDVSGGDGDALADTGAAADPTWIALDHARESLRVRRVAQLHPGADILGTRRLRPDDEGDGDGADRAAADRGHDLRRAEGRRDALHLQAELAIVDGIGGVDRQHQFEIDPLPLRPCRAGGERREEPECHGGGKAGVSDHPAQDSAVFQARGRARAR